MTETNDATLNVEPTGEQAQKKSTRVTSWDDMPKIREYEITMQLPDDNTLVFPVRTVPIGRVDDLYEKYIEEEKKASLAVLKDADLRIPRSKDGTPDWNDLQVQSQLQERQSKIEKQLEPIDKEIAYRYFKVGYLDHNEMEEPEGETVAEKVDWLDDHFADGQWFHVGNKIRELSVVSENDVFFSSTD